MIKTLSLLNQEINITSEWATLFTKRQTAQQIKLVLSITLIMPNQSIILGNLRYWNGFNNFTKIGKKLASIRLWSHEPVGVIRSLAKVISRDEVEKALKVFCLGIQES